MWKKIATWTSVGLISLACLLMISVLLGRVGVLGYRTYSVVSGSMSPTLDVGDVIYVTDGEPKVGDIVVLNVDGQLVTHRIVGLENGGFITKGDANEYPDTFQDVRITGIVRFHVPLLGHLSLAATGAYLSDRSPADVDMEAPSWDIPTETITSIGEEGAVQPEDLAPMTHTLSVEMPTGSSESSTTTTTTMNGEAVIPTDEPAAVSPDEIAAVEEEPIGAATGSGEGNAAVQEDEAP
jgi:signal peptidase I